MILRIHCRKYVDIIVSTTYVLVLATFWGIESPASETSSQVLLSEPDVEVRLVIEGAIPFDASSGRTRNYPYLITLKVTEERRPDVVSATCSILELRFDEDVGEAAGHPIFNAALDEGHAIDLTPSPGHPALLADVMYASQRTLVRLRYPYYIPPASDLEIRKVTALVDTRCSFRDGTLYRNETEVSFSMQMPTPEGFAAMQSHARGLVTKSIRTEEETNDLRALLSLPAIASVISDEEVFECLQRLEVRNERELGAQLLSLLGRVPHETVERYRRRIRTDNALHWLFVLNASALWDDRYVQPLLAKFEDTKHPRLLTTILHILERHDVQVPRARLTAALRNNGLLPSPDFERTPSPDRMQTLRRLGLPTSGSQPTGKLRTDPRGAGDPPSAPPPLIAQPLEMTEVTEPIGRLGGADLCSVLAIAGDLSTIELLTPLLEAQSEFGFVNAGLFESVPFPATRNCDKAHDAILRILGQDRNAAIAMAYHHAGIQNSLSPLSPSNIVPRWKIANDEQLAFRAAIAAGNSEKIIRGEVVSQPTFIDENGEVLKIRNQMLKNLINELQNGHIKELLEKSRQANWAPLMN